MSLKGGVGKTTVAALLGLTFAQHRGDRVIALDANPDAGTLAERLVGDTDLTVRDLLDALRGVTSWTDLSTYTVLVGRLHVLASQQDPAAGAAFSDTDYQQIAALLDRYFNIMITDSGTGLTHSAMSGTLTVADSVVVVGALTVDGASRAAKTLDWLSLHGYHHLVASAVVVLSADRRSPEVDARAIEAYFASRVRAVVTMPYDAHLAAGGRVELRRLRPEARLRALELAALVADGFPSLAMLPGGPGPARRLAPAPAPASAPVPVPAPVPDAGSGPRPRPHAAPGRVSSPQR